MNKMQKARAKLQFKHVFFATLVLSLPIEESDAIPTAATDMRKIIYNPKFIADMTVDQVMTLLAHEVGHVMFKHGLRRQRRNPTLFNIACDYAINLILVQEGFEQLDSMLLDRKYDGMSAEQIYDQLLQEVERQGGCGPQDGMHGDLLEPGEAFDQEAMARIEQEIQQRVSQAASVARMAGKLGGNLERVVNGIINPPLPWQELLREYMTRVSKDDESWTRRNRRICDAFLPARYSEQMGEIVVGVDTSGSISADDLAQVAAEIESIADSVKPERIRVVYVDAEIAGEEVFEPGDRLVLTPQGGGGTDMRVFLTHAEQFQPEVVVLLTDGYTPWPDHDPDYPLITCCTTNVDVPVGSVVRMRP